MSARGLVVCAVAAALGGCFAVVPRTETRTDIEDHEVVPQRTPSGPLHFAFRATATRLAITVSYPAICRDDVRVVAVRRTHTHASFAFEGADSGGNTLAVAIILAPITIPVTALYTAIAVIASGDDEVRSTVMQPGAPYACAAPAAGLALELVTEDGPFAHGATDANGAVELPIDSGVPVGTMVRLSASGEQHRVEL